MSKGHENLTPNERLQDPEFAKEFARKGGIASGKARRKKANLKAAAEMLLSLEAPEHEIKELLIEYGVEPTMENMLVFAVMFRGIAKGDHKALMSIRSIIGQDTTLADRREQKARTERMNAETERTRAEIRRKDGTGALDTAIAQAEAIADMIRTPEAERVLEDFLAPLEEGEGDDD